MFDIKKLMHVNGEWIRRIPLEEFLTRAREFVDSPALDALAPLAQERVKVLDELPDYFDWIDGPADDARSWDKAMKSPLAVDALDAIIDSYTEAPWTRDELHARFMALAERLDVSPRKIDAPLRVAVTGRTVGLPLFDVLEYLGRDETLRRLRAGRARLA
jgi:glutamyl-tRNA synthetase